MAQRKQWVRRVGTAATVAAAMTATTLVAGGTSASAAAGCRLDLTANTPTKSTTSSNRIIYTGSYRVSNCSASFTVELRLHRGSAQISTYRFNSSGPMSGASSLRSSATCSGTAGYHTVLVVHGEAGSSTAASSEKRITC